MLTRSIVMHDLSPSAGMTWYFFVQMFDHFRAFFTFVTNIHMWAYVLPIMIKYRYARA